VVVHCCKATREIALMLTGAGRSLAWQTWDGVHLVYQAASAETHVFNATTAGILHCLELGPTTLQQIAICLSDTMEVADGGLEPVDLEEVAERLIELGLVDYCVDKAPEP
jgi:PqqD family protein of HPr-rel-A system